MCVQFVSAHAHVLSHFSHVQLSATLQIVAHQAPLSMGFSKQEYWSGLPLLQETFQPRDQTCVSHASCIGDMYH